MAKLCGLKDPGGNGRKVYRGWEEGGGPSGPVAVLLSLYAAGIGSDDVSVPPLVCGGVPPVLVSTA
jgi:hypothetical protein